MTWFGLGWTHVARVRDGIAVLDTLLARLTKFAFCADGDVTLVATTSRPALGAAETVVAAGPMAVACRIWC